MSNSTYPLRHISIRVPWHDSGWNGTVCKVPKLNGACLKLENITRNKNDGAEAAIAGQSIEHLDQSQWPCCVSERGMFIAPFEYTRTVEHPYVETSPQTHGHFAPTSLRHPPYSAPAIPFLRMLREHMVDKYGKEYGLDVNPEWEPEMPFSTAWVQERRNQQALLDCFFQHVRPEESLCFFYAKQGQFKTSRMNGLPWALKVEFSSQPGFQYAFTNSDFSEENSSKLELAYALTIHKAQGSEFKTVVLVLPNPCRLLSRELLYTALTRQRKNVVILHQGERYELKRYASDALSDTAGRLTNLFNSPRPVEVFFTTSVGRNKPEKIESRFLEDRLIHRTSRGIAVRSKSEVIIADRLASHNIEPLYEKPLKLGDVTKYPDFIIEDDESGITYYWEHCGLLHDPAYQARWNSKLNWYEENDILPYQKGGGSRGKLIVTRDQEDGGISSQEIERVIQEVILA